MVGWPHKVRSPEGKKRPQGDLRSSSKPRKMRGSVNVTPRTGSTSTVGDVPCGNSYSDTLSSKTSTKQSLTPSLSWSISLQQPTPGMSHAVSPPQPATSAWLPGWSRRCHGAHSAVSPSTQTLTFETFSFKSPAPLARPTSQLCCSPTFFCSFTESAFPPFIPRWTRRHLF